MSDRLAARRFPLVLGRRCDMLASGAALPCREREIDTETTLVGLSYRVRDRSGPGVICACPRCIRC
jgi:hypothetical protein